MTRSRASIISLYLASCGLSLVMIACASSAPQRSEGAVDIMKQSQTYLTKARSQIDATLASMSGAMTAGPEQLRPAYDRFSKDVEKLRGEADSTKKHLEKMKAKKSEYLTAREADQAQVQNEELRRIAVARNAEARASYDRAVDAVTIAVQTFGPFMTDLTDLKKVLGNDLTPTGQALVASTAVVQNASSEGSRMTQSIDAALAQIGNAARDLTPMGIPPPKK